MRNGYVFPRVEGVTITCNYGVVGIRARDECFLGCFMFGSNYRVLSRHVRGGVRGVGGVGVTILICTAPPPYEGGVLRVQTRCN